MARQRIGTGIAAAVAAVVLFVAVGGALAQEAYPRKPITFIIPNEAGSSMDTSGRPLAELMQKELGQPMLIVNKPGAAGTIALRDVHGAKADGYTVGLAATAHYAKLVGLVPFDHNDLTVIGVPAGGVPGIMVPADRPWKSVKELVEHARSRPGELKVATTTRGGYWWLATKAFEKAAGIKLNVLAQPGGGGMVVTQVAGGHVDLGVAGLPESRSQIQAGTIRFLAMFGSKRVPGYEQIPALAEAGYRAEVLGVMALVAPKGLPKPVHEALARAFSVAARSPAYDKALAQMGAVRLGLVGEEAVKFLDEQAGVMRPILGDAGLLK
jgi:tripartite-type tricarboxylate transporter receptor subunit TctC